MKKQIFLTCLALIVCALFCAVLAEDALGKHQHNTVFFYESTGSETHERVEFCYVCEDAIGMVIEDHDFQNGECVFCGEPCPHDGTHTYRYTPVPGTSVWDGTYVEYDAVKEYVCNICGMVEESEIIRKSDIHQIHTESTFVRTEQVNEWYHNSVQFCLLCETEYTVFAPHSWEIIDYIPHQAEGHTELRRCTECKWIQESSIVPHTDIHVSWESLHEGDIETVTCAICELTYAKEMIEHDLYHFSWECLYGPGVDPADGHYEIKKCRNCLYQFYMEPVAHDISGVIYDTCSICGYADHNHEMGDIDHYDILDGQYHQAYSKCLYCRDMVAWHWERHTFDPYTLTCTECGYEADGCRHDPATEVLRDLSNEKTHTYRMCCKKCAKVWTQEFQHTPVPVRIAEELGTETEHVVELSCFDCGYLTYLPIEHTLTYQITAEGHQAKCENCEYAFEFAEHDGNGGVWYKEKKCSVCGYVDHYHHFVVAYYEPRNIGCNPVYKCDHPGCDVIKWGSLDHDYANPKTDYESIAGNTETHNKCLCCPTCGYNYRRTEEEHTFAEGFCIYCGHPQHVHSYVKRQDESNPHRSWEECACGSIINEKSTDHSYKSLYECISDKEHSFLYRCTECGYVSSSFTEAHTIVNGFCSFCDYSSDAFGEEPIFGSVNAPSEDSGKTYVSKAQAQPVGAVSMWFTLSVDDNDLIFETAEELIPDTDETILILVPQSEPEGEALQITIAREGLRTLAKDGVRELRIRLFGTDILVCESLAELYDALKAENPDAREDAFVLISASLQAICEGRDSEAPEFWFMTLA